MIPNVSSDIPTRIGLIGKCEKCKKEFPVERLKFDYSLWGFLCESCTQEVWDRKI
jgi:hypothetical protein